jgi:uncharacterized protein DUF3168
MYAEELLRQTLLESADVVALVKDRVHPDELPDGSPLPALVVTEVASRPNETLDGPTAPEMRRFAVEAFARTKPEAVQLKNAAKAALEGRSPAAAGLEIQGVFFLTSTNWFDQVAKEYRVTMDFETFVAGVES